MENYRIYFHQGEEEEILRILRKSHDVLIDQVNLNSVAITIDRSDADLFYVRLMDQIDREVFECRLHRPF